MAEYIDQGAIDCTVGADRAKVAGKTAIITGGANGIGAAYARALADAGAFVIIGDLDKVRAAELTTAYPERIWATYCEVTNWDHQVKLFEEAIQKSPTGLVDIVVANAGISGQDPVFVDDSSESKPQRPDLKILQINLIGAIYTIKLALYHFRKQYRSAVEAGHARSDTSLVLQGSLAGYFDQPGSPQYNASKFGLRGIMRSLRRTAWQHATSVNYIAPWFIKTDILSDAVAQRITERGATFAAMDDAVEALLRIASDPNIRGRSFAIVPRIWAPLGYTDIDHDDYSAGDRLKDWQETGLKTSHRLAGP